MSVTPVHSPKTPRKSKKATPARKLSFREKEVSPSIANDKLRALNRLTKNGISTNAQMNRFSKTLSEFMHSHYFNKQKTELREMAKKILNRPITKSNISSFNAVFRSDKVAKHKAKVKALDSYLKSNNWKKQMKLWRNAVQKRINNNAKVHKVSSNILPGPPMLSKATKAIVHSATPSSKRNINGLRKQVETLHARIAKLFDAFYEMNIKPFKLSVHNRTARPSMNSAYKSIMNVKEPNMNVNRFISIMNGIHGKGLYMDMVDIRNELVKLYNLHDFSHSKYRNESLSHDEFKYESEMHALGLKIRECLQMCQAFHDVYMDAVFDAKNHNTHWDAIIRNSEAGL